MYSRGKIWERGNIYAFEVQERVVWERTTIYVRGIITTRGIINKM